MIEKILDKYYSKKYLDYVEHMLYRYDLDYRIETKYGITKIYVKKKKYKDYEQFFNYSNYNSLGYLINIEENMKMIEKRIKCYLENNEE